MSSSASEDDVPLGSFSTAANGTHLPNGDAMSVDEQEQTPPPTRQANGTRLSKKRRAPLSSSDDSDVPLASSSPAKPHNAAVYMPGALQAVEAATKPAPKGRVVNGHAQVPSSQTKDESSAAESQDEDEDYDDDTPLKKRASTSSRKPSAAKKPPRKRKKIASDDSDEDDDAPLATAKNGMRKAAAGKGKAKARKKQSDDDIGMDDSDSKPRKKATTKRDPSAAAKGKKAKDKPPASPKKGKKEEAEEEEKYRWWEENGGVLGDGSVKWKTLEHSGVLFPPPYEPIPSNVKMNYKGKPVDLPPESEEVAGFFGAMLNTEHAENATFQKNFFKDFLAVLEKHPPRNDVKIKEFHHCDFVPMLNYYEAERAKKKALSNDEKKKLKAEKDAMEERFKTCLLDGRKEQVGNFRVEPPGLFRGRGDHPKKGALKHRVRPEDITINIGRGVKVPVPNMAGKWADVVNEDTVTWLANWKENINGNIKYVFLAAGSSLKGQSDMLKFEKARELKKHVDRIRQDYTKDLKSKLMADRQRATAMYFIDKFALRAGNEKGEDEADTVGCCSLRCEHVSMKPPDTLVFDFLGKDSIRYYRELTVDTQVFKNIRLFKANKDDEDALFDRVNTGLLNRHLASYMKGLTAKVFRTYNASITFQEQLDNFTPSNVSQQELLNAYNKANRMVAILCNHQRAVSKQHAGAMIKMVDKVRALKYNRMKLRHELFSMDKKMKKDPSYAEDESDVDEEWIAKHEEELRVKEREKAEKKFAKENEKLAENDEKAQPQKVLDERLEEIEAEFERLAAERGTERAEVKRSRTVEKLEDAIGKLETKIKTAKLQMEDREEGKEVSLGTSKINYLDPRITAAWCKIHDFPVEKIFSKTLLTKFPWAMEVDADWKF